MPYAALLRFRKSLVPETRLGMVVLAFACGIHCRENGYSERRSESRTKLYQVFGEICQGIEEYGRELGGYGMGLTIS